jgi:hypothetical protein
MLRPASFAGYLLAACVSWGQITPRSGPKIPIDLADLVRSDFDTPEAQKCLARQRVRLGQVLTAMRLGIAPKGTEVVLVQGLGICLGGANNGPYVIYARIGGRWQMVLAEVGNRVVPRAARTLGWRDLEIWGHASAFESSRRLFRFNGIEYRAAACDMVRRAGAVGTPLVQPGYALCGPSLPQEHPK